MQIKANPVRSSSFQMITQIHTPNILELIIWKIPQLKRNEIVMYGFPIRTFFFSFILAINFGMKEEVELSNLISNCFLVVCCLFQTV